MIFLKFDNNHVYYIHFQMDSKASPLAMLAKTCSQIGADPMPNHNASKTGLSSKKGSPDLLLLKSSPPIESQRLTQKESDSPNHNRSPKSTNPESKSRSSSAEIRVTDHYSAPNYSAVKPSFPKPSENYDKHSPIPTVRSGLEILSGSSGVPRSSAASPMRPVPPSVASYPNSTQ